MKADFSMASQVRAMEPLACHTCGVFMPRGCRFLAGVGRKAGNVYRDRICLVCDELFARLNYGGANGLDMMSPLAILCLGGRRGRWSPEATVIVDEVLEEMADAHEHDEASMVPVLHWGEMRERYGSDIWAERGRALALRRRA